MKKVWASHKPKQPTKKEGQEIMEKLTTEELKEKAEFEKQLDELHTVEFKKRELIFIFNILASSPMKYGDFELAQPVVEKLKPIVLAKPTKKTDENKLVGVN